MTPPEIITKILNAKSIREVFTDLTDYKPEFKRYITAIHTDHCKEPGAREATDKLLAYKEELEKGFTFKDDNGEVRYRGNTITITGEEKALLWSYNNFQLLRNLPNEEVFHRYLPTGGKLSGIPNVSTKKEENLTTFYETMDRVIALNALPVMEQKHVNWILSRLLEFSALLNQLGYVHAGLTLDSVFIMPELHGIIVPTFYHLTRIEQKLNTVSGKYKNFYPGEAFTNKKAIPKIDLEMCTRIAIYLLGDKSGIGNVLKATHNQDMITFLQRSHTDPVLCYNQYRLLLSKLVNVKEFHPLNI